MQLSYTQTGQGPLLVLCHGLFGDKNNLANLAKNFAHHYTTLCIDLPNHGASDWCDTMNYSTISQAILQLINQLGYQNYTLLGHSLGGKVAMAMLEQDREHIEQLIILDIAPIAYSNQLHAQEFSALHAVIEQQASSSSAARSILKNYIHQDDTINFLLKSFRERQWRFNLNSLQKNYANLAAWQPIAPYTGKIHFIVGQRSNYVLPSSYAALYSQFPQAKIQCVLNAGHWLHAEKPQQVLSLLHKILL